MCSRLCLNCPMCRVIEWQERFFPKLKQRLLCGVFAGLETDGIYRVSGNLAVIQKLRFLVNHGQYEENLAVPVPSRELLSGAGRMASVLFVDCFICAHASVKCLSTPPHVWPPECCLPQSELWPPTAVTCSPRSWCKVVHRLARKTKIKRAKEIQLSHAVLSFRCALLPP